MDLKNEPRMHIFSRVLFYAIINKREIFRDNIYAVIILLLKGKTNVENR